MQGYYTCEKCNIVIDVVTTSRNALKNSVKVKLPKCPHCGGKITETEYEDFIDAKPKLFLRLIRIFNFKHVGDRRIAMKVKFL